MNEIVRPPALRPGDTVGIAAPAMPGGEDMSWIERGLHGIRRLGLQVRLAEHALETRKHLTVRAERRAADLNALFADPEVKAIISVCGGSNAHALLPMLDWESIERNPKALIGYSAVTALLVGIHVRTRLVTFHGPMVMDGFSEFPELLPYTREQLERVVFTPKPAGVLRPPVEWTNDYPKEDSPREMQPNSGWRWLRDGRAEGRLLGGNLRALMQLAGTEYWPSFEGAILCFEEVNIGNDLLGSVDDSLAQMRMLGVFDKISGLVVGKGNDLDEEQKRLFNELVLYHTGGFEFPVLARVDFGHTDPRLVLPLGVRASLDSGTDTFALTEAAVS